MSVGGLMEATARVRRGGGTAERDHWYRTPPACTHALLDRETFTSPVWEPACGDGVMAEAIRERGYEVIVSDLIDRGYGTPRVDFLLEQKRLCDSLITNPPCRLADEFIEHAFALGCEKIAIFQRLAWFEGADRYERIFSRGHLVRAHVFSRRQTLWRGDDPDAKDRGGAIPFAWFVFERGFRGDAVVRWIA